MVPDKNLALYTARHTAKKVLTWAGCCNIHDALTAREVLDTKAAHPQAVFVAHPECRPEVLDLADSVQSTSGMISLARTSRHDRFIVGTEVGILHPLSRANPQKEFIPADPHMVCTDMKKTGLADLLKSLEEMAPVVTVSEQVRGRARRALEAMLAIP